MLTEVGCGLSVACGRIVTVGNCSSTVLACRLVEVGCGLSVACGTVRSSTISVCELGCGLSVGCGLLVIAGSSTRLLVEVCCGISAASGLLITVGSSMILVCEWKEVGCGPLVVDREGERGVESATKTRR